VEGLSLQEDNARMEMVSDVIGPDFNLKADVNSACEHKMVIEVEHIIENLKPTLPELPVQWVGAT